MFKTEACKTEYETVYNKIVKKNKFRGHANSGAIYGMGFIGALIYFLQHATSFMAVVIGIIKAIFWPAVVIYRVLQILGL